MNNPVTDLSPLASAINLTSLSVGGSDTVAVTDVATLGQFTQLTYLSLVHAKPTSMTWLPLLTQLQRLAFTDVKFGPTGVQGVAALPLTSFYVSSSDLADLSPLQSLTLLTNLSLYLSPFSDISPLVDNPGLGAGDYVVLTQNSALDCTAQAANLAALRSTGLTLYTDCP